MNELKFCWYSSVCEQDAVWLDQYLREAERLKMPFSMYLDRCSQEVFNKVILHPLCVGVHSQDDPDREYDETAKQVVFEEACKRAQYVISTDIDETWDRDFYNKFYHYERDLNWDSLKVHFPCLWDSPDQIRVDGQFAGCSLDRTKIYRTTDRLWIHKNACVQGAYLRNRRAVELSTEINCIHWGYMTRELREAHKAKWDRVYGAHNEKNPYDLWAMMCNEEQFPPIVEKHNLF